MKYGIINRALIIETTKNRAFHIIGLLLRGLIAKAFLVNGESLV